MKRLRALRTRAGVSAAAVLLSAAGIAMASATPATAYAGYCNGQASKYLTLTLMAKLPAYNGNIDCYMAQGADSSAVSALQTTLNQCYGRSLDVDGDFGSLTKAALKYAQGVEKLTYVDGIYGSETRNGIGWYFDNTNGAGGTCAYL
jgi:hypothetical protein